MFISLLFLFYFRVSYEVFMNRHPATPPPSPPPLSLGKSAHLTWKFLCFVAKVEMGVGIRVDSCVWPICYLYLVLVVRHRQTKAHFMFMFSNISDIKAPWLPLLIRCTLKFNSWIFLRNFLNTIKLPLLLIVICYTSVLPRSIPYCWGHDVFSSLIKRASCKI